MDVPLSCRCGRVRGVAQGVSAATGFRFVCYCADCRAVLRLLDRADALDEAGGTDVFQLPPARVAISEGIDELRCLKLPEAAYVLRWYTACCKTPIGNTATTPSFPMLGMVHTFMQLEGRARDEALGPPRCRIFERSATGPLPASAPPPPSLGVSVARRWMMLGWWLRGLARPTPFFDEQTGAPRAPPRLMTEGELRGG